MWGRRGESSVGKEPELEFRPSKAAQKQESKRLRPVAVLPALALLVGVGVGIMTATDRRSALFVYLGLFVFSGCVAVAIIGVLLVRNRRFLANAVVRVSDHSIEYTDARGKVVAFDRADPSLKALLAWVLSVPPSEGIRLPPSMTLFVSNQTRSIRLRGADWEIDDLEAVVRAANTPVRPSGRNRRTGRAYRTTEEGEGMLPLWDRVNGTSAVGAALSARQVNDLIPGAMSFRETHPLTFALLTAFGSVAVLAAVVIGIAVAQSAA